MVLCKRHRGTDSSVCGRMGSLASCAPYMLESTGNRGFGMTYDGSYHSSKKAGQGNSASCLLCGNKKLIVYDLISFKVRK